MKIMVTGGAGFIGSHTVERLVANGHLVRVIDDFSTGRESNLSGVAKEINIEAVDIRDYVSIEQACRGIDAIIHLAAISSVEKSVIDPLSTHAVNVTGTLNVLEAARQKGVKRVVFSSSAAVFGNHPELPKTENSPIQPQSPYASQKLMSETYGFTYSRLFGLKFIAFRYFNVYGPRQDPKSPYTGVLSTFMDNSFRGKVLTIDGDGEQTRDFINVDDVSKANVRAVESRHDLPDIINVATGAETKIIDIAKMIVRLTKNHAGLHHGPSRKGDIRRSYSENNLLINSLKLNSTIGLQHGLKSLVGDDAFCNPTDEEKGDVQ